MGLEFSESCPIGIGNQLQKVTRIRFLRPRTYITFRLRSVLNLGSVIISVFLSFPSPPHFHFKENRSKNTEKQRMLLQKPQALCEVDASAGRDKVKKKSTMPATANRASNQLANSLGQFLLPLCKKKRQSQKLDQNGKYTHKYLQKHTGFGWIWGQ